MNKDKDKDIDIDKDIGIKRIRREEYNPVCFKQLYIDHIPQQLIEFTKGIISRIPEHINLVFEELDKNEDVIYSKSYNLTQILAEYGYKIIKDEIQIN